MPINEMLEIESFDEDTVNELRSRARNALLVEAIASEEHVENVASDLLTLEGMDNETARVLAAKGVTTQEDLADLAVDDLVELTGIDAERAKQLIMTARAPWFAASQGVTTYGADERRHNLPRSWDCLRRCCSSSSRQQE